MSTVHEIAIRAGADHVEAVRRWFEAGPATAWRELPGLRGFDVYVAVVDDAKDPYVDDGAGPCVMCMLDFPDEDTLRAAIGGEIFRRAFAGIPSAASITAETMERKFYSVDGEADEQALEAPFSYMVRYHRPAEDERAFIDNYVATHPALLATLPKIRSVMCYFPLGRPALRPVDPDVFASPDYMIGNEVAFDSVADFNAAMASPVRHELRRHYREFPRFSGANTHYPMMRTRLR